MDAEINNVIYMELNSGPKIAKSTCGKTIDVEMIDRDSTVYHDARSSECQMSNSYMFWQRIAILRESTRTKGCKPKMLIQLTGIIKVLEF